MIPVDFSQIEHQTHRDHGTAARLTAGPDGTAGTDSILTLDRRDFRAMRRLTTHKWFRLRPDDL
jgi:hypothetical protein